MDNKDKMIENNNKVIELIETGLKEGKNLLIQSLPGYGRNHLTKSAAEKAGITLAEFKYDGISFHGLPNTEEKDRLNSGMTEEEAILFSLKDKKINAILVNSIPGDNLDVYVNAAKKNNIPLIVSVSRNDPNNLGIVVNVVDKVDDMKPLLDEIKPVANQPVTHFDSLAVRERVKQFRLSPEQLAETEKPKLK